MPGERGIVRLTRYTDTAPIDYMVLADDGEWVPASEAIAANARIEELDAEAKDHESDVDKWVAAESAANARIAELQVTLSSRTMRVQELQDQLEKSDQEHCAAQNSIVAANARADAAEREMRSTELCARHYEKRLIEEKELFAAMVLEFGEAKDRAEAEAAQWKAKCEAAERAEANMSRTEATYAATITEMRAEAASLRVELASERLMAKGLVSGLVGERNAAESSLADARALLDDAGELCAIEELQGAPSFVEMVDRIVAWLAANPEVKS